MFDHEKLHVYQSAIRFVAAASELLSTIPRSVPVHNQLDRASTSIPLNIAEGNGKFTSADRCRDFDIARGSPLESAAALDVIVAKGLVESNIADQCQGVDGVFCVVAWGQNCRSIAAVFGAVLRSRFASLMTCLQVRAKTLNQL